MKCGLERSKKQQKLRETGKRNFKETYNKFRDRHSKYINIRLKKKKYKTHSASRNIKKTNEITKNQNKKKDKKIIPLSQISNHKRNNFILKNLVPLSLKFLNPLKHCFVTGFIFPLNANSFGTLGFEKHDLVKGNEYTSLFNRIICMEKNLKKNITTLKTEPRVDKISQANQNAAHYFY